MVKLGGTFFDCMCSNVVSFSNLSPYSFREKCPISRNRSHQKVNIAEAWSALMLCQFPMALQIAIRRDNNAKGSLNAGNI